MGSDAPTIVGGGHEVVCSLRDMLIKLVLMDVMLNNIGSSRPHVYDRKFDTQH